MRKQPNTRMIGFFITAGLAAFLLIISTYIGSKIFTENDTMLVMYFEESIKGLNVGSPVVFKGVEIGKVAKIDLIANAQNLDFRIPVYAKMEARQNITSNDYYEDKRALLDALIAKGLRARLTSQSYLTGQLMIELEMLPDSKIVMSNQVLADNILEIPTVLSPIGELSKGIQDIPIRQSVEKFNHFFDELNAALPVLLPQIKEAAAGMSRFVNNNAQVTADTIDNLNRTIIYVGEAAKNLRNFADYIDRHPEALFRGKGGK